MGEVIISSVISRRIAPRQKVLSLIIPSYLIESLMVSPEEHLRHPRQTIQEETAFYLSRAMNSVYLKVIFVEFS